MDPNTAPKVPLVDPLPVSQQSPYSCPFCKRAIPENSTFCPYCGKVIHERISIGRIIWIYIICLFAPPFGLVYFFKYIGKKDKALRKVAIVSLVLTVISIIITGWWGIGLYNAAQQQVMQYQKLGL
ncbi:MAG TPA: zinc ribbon domain-containing protein [Patescibacteria group bacterium]|nr:zinc ribbon domain-containing protein [Patescibacteria group bacterium]